jgi:hypothetical protein
VKQLKLKLLIYLLNKHLVSIKSSSDKIDDESVMKTAYKHYIENVKGTIMLIEADLESTKRKDLIQKRLDKQGKKNESI